jgi:hypothetical protein
VNCRDCDKAIPQARLDASPLAERCLGCQKHVEALHEHFHARLGGANLANYDKEGNETEKLEAVEQSLRDKPVDTLYQQIEGLEEIE